MKNKLSLMLLALFASSCVLAQSNGTAGGLTWVLSADSVLTISGTGAMPDYDYTGGSVLAPWPNIMKEIVIESGVTSIGNNAFLNCNSLTLVTIPNTVTTLGNNAFAGCSSLDSVAIPNSVTQMSAYAFYDCAALASVTVSWDVPLAIDFAEADWFFMGCGYNYWNSYSLEGITLYVPRGKQTAYADDGCWGRFTVVEIVNNSGTTGGLTWVLSADSVLTISGTGAMPDYDYTGGSVFAPWPATMKEIVIESGVTSIGNNAFLNCNSLTLVTIPNTVTTLGSNAFASCSSLDSVTIPNSVTQMSAYAFYDCAALASVTVSWDVPLAIDFAEADYFFLSCGENWTSYDLKQMTLYVPQSAKTAYENDDCWGRFNVVGVLPSGTAGGLTWVLSADSVLTISGTGAMPDYDYTGGSVLAPWPNIMKEIVIESGVTSIGNNAFLNCNSLTLVTIPNTVTTLGNNAFASCQSLTSVTIPNSVTQMSAYAYYDCKALASVTVSWDVPLEIDPLEADDYFFLWCGKNWTSYYLKEMTLYVPEGKFVVYYEHNCWGRFTVVEDITVSIGTTKTESKSLSVVLAANGELVIESNDALTGRPAYLYNISGQRVASKQLSGRRTTLNVSHLSAGMYLLKCGNETLKFVKR